MNKSMLICLVFLASSALAWWEVGHMMTAQVAKSYLEENNVDALLWAESMIADFNPLTDGRSNTFVEASVWADDIKEPGNNFLDNWHFTDHPINEMGKSDNNIISLMILIDPVQIQYNSIDSMRRARLVMTNRKTINLDHTWAKAQMIRYILHVIGDMHQPLHNCNFYNETFKKGDLGGNLIKLKKLDGTSVNLHAYWDAGAFVLQPSDEFLIRPLNTTAVKYMESWAKLHMTQHPMSSFAHRDMKDISKWTQEGYKQAMDVAYPFTANNSQITEEYQNQVYTVVEENIILGGYRLATLLIDIHQNVQEIKQSVSFVESKLNSINEKDNQIIEQTESSF